MKNLKTATIELFDWLSEAQDMTKEQALSNSDFVEEFEEVYVEHFETLLHEQLITKSTLKEAEELEENENIINYLKSIL